MLGRGVARLRQILSLAVPMAPPHEVSVPLFWAVITSFPCLSVMGRMAKSDLQRITNQSPESGVRALCVDYKVAFRHAP